MKGNGRHLLAVLLTVGMIIGNMSGAVYADEIQPSAASESVLETETSDTADEIVDSEEISRKVTPEKQSGMKLLLKQKKRIQKRRILSRKQRRARV